MTDKLNETTIDEVLTAVNDFANDTKKRFDDLESRVNNIESTMATKDDLATMATKNDLAGFEMQMVTKAYLDDKLADLGAEIGGRIMRRQEKEKTFKQELINYLKKHSLFDQKEIERLENLI